MCLGHSVNGRRSQSLLGRPGTGFLWRLSQWVTSKNRSGNSFRCNGAEDSETRPTESARPVHVTVTAEPRTPPRLACFSGFGLGPGTGSVECPLGGLENLFLKRPPGDWWDWEGPRT